MMNSTVPVDQQPYVFCLLPPFALAGSAFLQVSKVTEVICWVLHLGCILFFWPIWIWILQSKIRCFIPFHCNLILDCNPSPKLVLDCSFHLINQFIDPILDCLTTWTADQKSPGNLDPGTSVWKQICFWILMFQLVSNLIQFSIEESRFRLVKRNAPLHKPKQTFYSLIYYQSLLLHAIPNHTSNSCDIYWSWLITWDTVFWPLISETAWAAKVLSKYIHVWVSSSF